MVLEVSPREAMSHEQRALFVYEAPFDIEPFCVPVDGRHKQPAVTQHVTSAEMPLESSLRVEVDVFVGAGELLLFVAKQTAELVAATTFKNVPAGQLVHIELPLAFLYVPAAHALQP